MCGREGMHGGGRGACGRGHAKQGGVHGRGACMKGGMHGSGGGGVCGRKDGHCSGRYASYWNAFLFKFNMTLTANMEIAFRIYSV